jgi:uncharacterized protein with NRDE domain
MCLLAVLHQVVGDCPVVVAANREESYARGGTPPQRWEAPHPFLAGQDPKEGGTWLGVNACGVLVAVTNRHDAPVPRRPRSRGLLCRDLLQCRSALEAHERAAVELATGHYAGCNLISTDQTGAWVVEAGTSARQRALPPGIHVLANGNVGDPHDPRVARVQRWLAPLDMRDTAAGLAPLQRLCALHGDGPEPPVCLHLAAGGTVSCSLIALSPIPERIAWQHAQGPPCQTEFKDISDTLRALLSTSP